MTLQVKAGCEYVLGGKVYRGGDTVEGVPDKFIKILAGPKGPLELAGHARPVAAELPPAAYQTRAVEPEPDPLAEAPRPKRQYRRRDMRAER